MITYVHFELSEFRPVILAYPAPCCVPTPLKVVPYGAHSAADHRQDYTAEDALVVCNWLNQRVEYQQNLRFPSPASSIGSELGSEAASATVAPFGGERGMSSASVRGADALVETEIVLTERELLEAELLISRETF